MSYSNLLLFPMLVGGPYTNIKMPKSRHQTGIQVGCHVCGAVRVTLYKDGDRRICKRCRDAKEDLHDCE